MKLRITFVLVFIFSLIILLGCSSELAEKESTDSITEDELTFKQQCEKSQWPPSCESIPDATAKELCERCRYEDQSEGFSQPPSDSFPDICTTYEKVDCKISDNEDLCKKCKEL